MSRIQDAIHRYVACRAILDHGVSVFAVGDPAGAQLNVAIRRALFVLGEDRSAVWNDLLQPANALRWRRTTATAAELLPALRSNVRKHGQPPFLVRITSQAPRSRSTSRTTARECLGTPSPTFPGVFACTGHVCTGTGLGLFVVRALAEAQGGSVTYTSGSPHGSVFTRRRPTVPA